MSKYRLKISKTMTLSISIHRNTIFNLMMIAMTRKMRSLFLFFCLQLNFMGFSKDVTVLSNFWHMPCAERTNTQTNILIYSQTFDKSYVLQCDIVGATCEVFLVCAIKTIKIARFTFHLENRSAECNNCVPEHPFH